ncbi:MAG: hypothetical protein UZ15_CFX003001491 [Chloroflexi bacterium OLB15]|nr:MAG: hypothetical protein UZ15_CFX003001491 [Chloroflexi bacterium OLB15]
MRAAKYKLTTAEKATAKEEMRAALIDAARKRELITYSELCLRIPGVGLYPHSFIFTQLLREVCHEEYAKGHRQLCALVVRKATGMPGGGYFSDTAPLKRDFGDLVAEWRADVEDVFEYWSTH